jgi:hypothetical protein
VFLKIFSVIVFIYKIESIKITVWGGNAFVLKKSGGLIILGRKAVPEILNGYGVYILIRFLNEPHKGSNRHFGG